MRPTALLVTGGVVAVLGQPSLRLAGEQPELRHDRLKEAE